ncbi:B-box zinc finger protein 21 [Arabidopsis thaliana]|uniref:STH2 n=2 Tax=Arabidopsis TaxID=3701 RepID=A0A178WQ55_ARATH|nr:B-box-type zinc finger [Arabidopsis thaliana x Arabidopsis arenosa]OAP19252.1 STH2 [Arabidopsis thaliana]
MMIRCDVCDKEEASVFCTADEASLCGGCDHQVHHANKLASKHLRFSLLYPSSSNTSSPLCDICQDKKALLFCQQDRAILCKDCDSSIHAANEHTKKHDRFLLTGVKLSATSSVYKPTSKSSSSSSSNQDFSVPGSSISNPPPLKKPLSAPPQSNKIQPFSKINGGDASVNQWGSTSTISEYLMDTLPGWHVEDFLDSSLPTYGFSKSGDDDGVLPYMEPEDDNNTKRNNNNNNNNNTVSLPSKNLGIWVPQIPQTLPSSYPNQYFSQDNNIQFGMYNKETSPEVVSFAPIQNMKQQGQNNKRWYDDGGFTVPQITPPPLSSNKKFRSFW